MDMTTKGFCMKLHLAAAAALTMVAGGLLVSPAHAVTTERVTETNVTRAPENTPPSDHWMLYTRTPASTGAFVSGPATPPIGGGSFQMSTPGGGDKVQLFNYDHVGTKLSDVNAIAYDTYRTAGNDQQVAALNLEVDFNGPAVSGGFTTLVFEPVYNTSQGAVASGMWQHWDAYNGGGAKWWSTKSIPGVCAFDCFVSWSDIVAANPDATILGGVGLNQGSGNGGLTTSVDAFTFNDTTYDFDVPGKDDCKNNGWMKLGFKNQGQCVASFTPVK